MSGELSVLEIVTFVLSSGIALSAPYLYSAIGEVFVERSGIFNLGIDGIMLLGAFSSYFVTLQTGSMWLGLLMAVLSGTIMGLLMALFTVTLGGSQGIAGIGVFMLGSGIANFFFKVRLGTYSFIDGFSTAPIPFLSDIPVIGEILFQHNLLVYGAFLLFAVSWYVIHKTPLGLKIRSVGENPQAADSLGISVPRMRYLALSLGGAFAGVGGAYLSLALVKTFQEGMTNGIGFIALALVYFGGWRLSGVLAGALLFSLVTSAQLWMQLLGVNIPSDLLVMLPYLLTILVLILPIIRGHEPSALGDPYLREEH